MSKATKVIFSLGTKRALGLFYMTLPGFSVALKKKKKKRMWKKKSPPSIFFFLIGSKLVVIYFQISIFLSLGTCLFNFTVIPGLRNKKKILNVFKH